MKSEVLAKRDLVRGAASRADRCFLLSKGKALAADEVAHTSVIGLDGGRWAKAGMVPWDSTAIAIALEPSRKVVLIGEDGQVGVYAAGRIDVSAIQPRPKMIRNARCIAGHVYVCGMLRQVYRRVDEQRWVDLSPRAKRGARKGGFESIDGYGHEELYAVGWNGEVWHYDASQWHHCASPTNLILSAVCCAGDGVVYAAGQQGVMLKGRADTWENIDWDDEVSADLWDLCWFDGKLYVATILGLYTLEGARLAPVDFGPKIAPRTCFNLTTAEGVLWSIGQNDVLSFDGKAWTAYD